MIEENGFEQFYDLKQGLAVAPVRSRPFEEHDFSWLGLKVAEAEGKAKPLGEAARMEVALEGISCVGCVWLVEKLFARRTGSVRALPIHPVDASTWNGCRDFVTWNRSCANCASSATSPPLLAP